ncbi:MAG TPA: glycoside hydrolase family 25 protein [Spirillospora sp.]|nr:glycoside hydrolase family 25 protein [Spirillospora sp.]
MSNQRIDIVDLSHWNAGPVGWKAMLHAGVKAVYHKATEGAGYVDPKFVGRRRGAREAGMPFGAYHFARPAASSGTAQARHFLRVAGVRPGDPRPMLDLEDRGGKNAAQLTAWVSEFVAEVRRQLGCPPFLYTRFNLTHTLDCPLWVARYSNSNAAPKVPSPWKVWTGWQFSNGQYGRPNYVAGAGHADLTTLNSADPRGLLRKLRVPNPHTKPAPKPKPKPKPKPEPEPPAPKAPTERQTLAALRRLLRRLLGLDRKGTK